MYVGTQNRAVTDDEYRHFAQLGVTPCLRRPGRQPARLDARYAEAPPRPARRARAHPRHGAAAARLMADRALAEPRHPPRGPRARPADRLDLPADRERRRGRHPGGQVQPQHHRHPALRVGAGPRRLAELDLPLGQDGPERRRPASPASSTRTRTGSASTISSSACPGRREQQGPPRLPSRTTPTRRPAIAASRACSARSRG